MFDRFTRDEVSAKVWWPVALVMLIALVLSFPARNALIDRAREDAVAEAVALTETAVVPAFGGADVSTPLPEDQASEAARRIELGTAGTAVAAVRLWGEDGDLRFSTEERDVLGSSAGLNDETLVTAATATAPVVVLAERSVTGEEADPSQSVYMPAGDAASSIVQVEYDDAALLGALGERWLLIQLVLLAGLAVTLLLAGLSMREPIAPIGAKVPFYPTSVPAHLAVVSREEATRARHADQHVRDRLAAMQTRVDELEAEKYELQGDLQRALSSLATFGAGRPSSVIGRPSQAPTPVPAASPEPEPEAPAPVAEAPAPVATPAPAPVPTPKRRGPVEADEVTVVVPSKSEVAEVADEPVAPAVADVGLAPVASPVVEEASDEPETIIQPEVVEEPEPVAEVVEAPVVRLPESEVLPVPTPAPVAAASVASTAPSTMGEDGRDADVLDVLERLVEPAGGQTLHPELDPAEIRARLAKTAAAKKPGARQDRERFSDGGTPPAR